MEYIEETDVHNEEREWSRRDCCIYTMRSVSGVAVQSFDFGHFNIIIYMFAMQPLSY